VASAEALCRTPGPHPALSLSRDLFESTFQRGIRQATQAGWQAVEFESLLNRASCKIAFS
jgi:hypothetical protein